MLHSASLHGASLTGQVKLVRRIYSLLAVIGIVIDGALVKVSERDWWVDMGCADFHIDYPLVLRVLMQVLALVFCCLGHWLHR